MINRSFLRIFFFILLVVPCFSSCSDKSDVLFESGVTKELAVFRKNTISNVKYALFFDLSKDEKAPIISKLELSFLFNKEITDLILDFKSSSNNILSVTIGGKAVDYKVKNGHLILDKALLNIKNKIFINFIASNKSLNRSEDYLYSLFVPDKASTCFPLFDQPDLKANYKLTLKIPKNWVALSNSSVEEIEVGVNYSKVIFNETQLISSYLFSFTAGNYKVEEIGELNREIKLYHLEKDSIRVAMNIKEIAKLQNKSIEWMENFTEIPYPFEKFDIVAIPNFSLDGMENPGNLYYRESSIFLDENASELKKTRRVNLIAHESAHMWFGNLVTMMWFDDLWVKEAFSSHLSYLFTKSEYPDLNADLDHLMRNYTASYQIDRSKGSHPVRQELNNSINSKALYDNIIYNKTPIVFQLLQDQIGNETYRKSVRQYLNKYSFGNAKWEDFMQILNINTSEDLSQWEKAWLNSSGMPSIGYTMKEKDSILIKFKILYRNADNDKIWPQTIDVGFGKDNEFKSFKVHLNKSSQKLNVDSAHLNPQYLFTNYGGFGYGYFKMGPLSKTYFLDNMHLINSSNVRGALWINLYEAVLRSDIDAMRWMNSVLKAITKEKEPIILNYLNEKIISVFWNFLSDSDRIIIGSKMEGVLFNMILNTDSDDIRGVLFKSFYKVATSDNGVDLMSQIWNKKIANDNLALSDDDYISIAYELAIRKPDSANFILKKQLGSINNLKKKEKMKWVMKVLDPDLNVRDQFFESLKESKNRINEEWVIESLQYLHHPLRQKESIKYILPSLAILEDVQDSGSIFFTEKWLNTTLRGHQSESAADIVRQFLYRKNKYPVSLKNKILQSADLLFRSNDIIQQQKRK